MWRFFGLVLLSFASGNGLQLSTIRPQILIGSLTTTSDTSTGSNSSTIPPKMGATEGNSAKNSTGIEYKTPATPAVIKLLESQTRAVNFPTTLKSSQNSTTDKMTNYSCFDAANSSSADPEKCCAFPDLFPDPIVDQCEKEFGVNVSTANTEMLGDSVS